MSHRPVRSADRAFTMLPPTWEGSAEILGDHLTFQDVTANNEWR
ncbi:MAG TPA: hypothetical protein VLB46_00470 [Pyrinomonadaceae bacterium]|nr:hypothetical protein [Pyrinomonadaceae bacterium]